MQRRHFFHFVCCLPALLSACAKRAPAPPALFSKGVYPLVFRAEDFALHPKTGNPMHSSEDCAGCHETVYRNWQKSRHKVALTNELYKESHAREPSPWCVNCHAPLRMTGSEKIPHRGEEGISCLVCHVRGGEILTGALPVTRDAGDNGQLAHKYRIDAQFKDERLCEHCHEFNFPTASSAMSEGKDLHYTEQPMQSTVSEYRASAYYGKVTCQGCHLFRDTAESHTFPGGHALERLKKDLRVEAVRESESSLTLRIYAQGIGHAFPTGDLFRTLRLLLYDKTVNEQQQVELRHFFENPTAAQSRPQAPLKLRVADETLPPPKTDYLSVREYVLPWPAQSRRVTTELYIDYLSEQNSHTTHLPAKLTRPLIKKQTFPLKASPATDTKG
jgi:hypothetical protein